MMMNSLPTYRPQFYAASPATPAAASTPTAFRPSALIKFGVCVNAQTSKAQFQERLLTEDLRSRLHAIASAGNVASADFAQVLADLLLKNNAFNNDVQAKRAGDQLYEFTLMALVESALKNPTLKENVLETLEKAKKSKHLRKQYALIDEALKKLRGHDHAPSSDRWRQREQEYRHEQTPHHH